MPRESSEHHERGEPPEDTENDETPENEERSERVKEIVHDATKELEYEESAENAVRGSIEEIEEVESHADRAEEIAREAAEELRGIEEELGEDLEDVREELHEEFINDMKSQLEGPSLKETKEESSESNHDRETSETTESSQSYIEGGDGTVYVVETGGASEGHAESEFEETGETEHQETPQAPEGTAEENEPDESVKVSNSITHPELAESEETEVPSEPTKSQEKTEKGREVCQENYTEEESMGESHEKRVRVSSEVEETILPTDEENIKEVGEPIEEPARENAESVHDEGEVELQQDISEAENNQENNMEIESEETGGTDELEEHAEESIEVPEEIIRKIEGLLEELGELEEEEVDGSRVIIDAMTGERYIDHSLEPRPYFSETEEDREREEEERIRERLKELFSKLSEEEREKFKESVRPEIESEKELEELVRRWRSRVMSPDFKQNLEDAREHIRNKKRGEVPRLIRELRALEVEQQWMKTVRAVARKKMLRQLTTMMHSSKEVDSSRFDSRSREKSLLSLQKFIPPTFEDFKHALKERPELKTRKDYKKALRLAEVYYKVKEELAREDFSHMSQRAMLRHLSMKYNVPPTSLKNWVVGGALPRLIDAIAREELKKSDAMSDGQSAAKKKRPSMPRTYEDFLGMLERHPYLREIEGFEEKVRDVHEYFRLIELQKKNPHLSKSELARRVVVDFDTARSWLGGRKPDLLGIVLTNEQMRIQCESQLAPEAIMRTIETSSVYESFKHLKLKENQTIEKIAETLVTLYMNQKIRRRVTMISLQPYNRNRGPRWTLKIASMISENRERIENMLNNAILSDSTQCLRLGLVRGVLYIWSSASNQFDYLELYSDELFFFSKEFRKYLTNTAMKHLGLRGNYLLGNLIKQITTYKPDGLSGEGRVIQELKPQSCHIRGSVLKFILDSLDLTLNDVEGKIDRIGVGGQIINPHFPDEASVRVLMARLYAAIGSDGSIANDYRAHYYENVTLRHEKIRRMLQILGDLQCGPVYKKDGTIGGLKLPGVIGRILVKLGMPVGDKVLQGVRIPEFIMNGPPEVQLAYLEELIPEEGWISIDKKDNIRIGWARSVVLYDGKKAKKFKFKQKISTDLVDIIEKYGVRHVRNYPSGVEEIFFTLSIGALNEIIVSANPEDAFRAKELDRIIRENSSDFIEDEKHLCSSNGIMTSEQCPSQITRYLSSDRVSVKWTTRAASENDVALWGILASPNDEQKKQRLNGWMKRHEVKAAHRKMEHSQEEIQRLGNETTH